jgi:2'-phosphotransferase
VKLDDIISHYKFKDVTREEIITLVSNCSKQRYHLEYLKDENDLDRDFELYIRANQGHSIQDIEVDLQKITEINLIEKCIHGTNYSAWSLIRSQVILFLISCRLIKG